MNLILCPPFWNKMPPLGLAILSSIFKNSIVYDLNIEFYHKASKNLQKKWILPETNNIGDLQKEFEERIKQIAQTPGKNLFGFSMFHSNKPLTLRSAELIKQINPNAKIIFGGPEIPKRGQPLLACINKGIKGAVPFCFDAFDLKKYTRHGFLPILLGQGCVNNCKFCMERLLHEGYYCRGHEIVIKEIESYIEKYNVKNFIFHDSLINANLKELGLFCDEVIKRKLPIKWEGQVYINKNMSVDFMRKMKQAGCYNIFIGVESFSDKVLKYFNKGYSSAIALDFLQKLKQAGLHSELSFILGSQIEDEQSFNETLDFIKNNKHVISKIAQVNGLKILPGIDLAAQPADVVQDRVQRFIKLLEKDGIVFTREFVNNL